MVATAPVPHRLSYDEYLALERSTGERHEYCDGEVRAMAGGTTAHSRVKTSLLRAVDVALDGKPCLALDSDQKIHVAETGLTTYPDLSVTCGPLQRSAADRHAIENPTLVAEVLSDSTEGHDLGKKRRHYQRVPSLQQMLFVWPEARAVEIHTRGEGGAWIVRDAPGDAIRLDSIDVTIDRAALFARLDEVEDPAEAAPTEA